MDTGQLDFNRVATFVQIASAGGVTAAAAQLKRPKSSISRALSQLEEDLGVELVVRNSRRFRLTEAGEAFYRAASKGIATVDDAREELRRDRMIPHGHVRLAAPASAATTLLPPVLTQFVRKYPRVQIELVVTSGQVDPVRDGFDLVVSSGRLSDSSAKIRALVTTGAGIFASAAYLEARGTPLRPSDLAKHECILRSPSGQKDRWRLSGPSGTVVVAVDGHLRVDDLMSAAAACAADGGLALLPVHLPLMGKQSLQRVLPNYMVRGESMQLVYPAHRHAPLRVTLLCDAILEYSHGNCPGAETPAPRRATNRPESRVAAAE